MWFRTRARQSRPRLQPELDDTELARAIAHVEAQIAAQCDNLAESNDRGALTYPIERVLREAGEDWDRRTHRLGVLANMPDAVVLADQWRSRQPSNGDAILFHAWAQLATARANGSLPDAEAVIGISYRAADLLPADPAPWVAILGCCRILRTSVPQTQPAWREVMARHPWNREAHLQMLRYCSPEECGSNVLTVQFVDSVVASAPPGSPIASLELAASLARYQRTVDMGGVIALTARRHWDQHRERSLLDHALTSWPRPGFLHHAAALADLNLLAFVLTKANRPADAKEVFQSIGTTVTAWPWEVDGAPLEAFVECRGRACR
jgi:hypothetical protein